VGRCTFGAVQAVVTGTGLRDVGSLATPKEKKANIHPSNEANGYEIQSHERAHRTVKRVLIKL
jgi:hypothetical protein